MCGRYALALSNEEVYDSLEARLPRMFENGRPRWERQQDHRGSYNIAPRSRAPVVRRDPDNSESTIIETMQWGLIPHWTKHPPTGGLNTINARSEGLLDSSSGGMWHAMKGYKRCIVPAQGYYEWLKKPNTKIPHFTRLPLGKGNTVDHPPLLFFAGLYDIVKYVSPVESSFKPRTQENEDGTVTKDTREPYPTGNPLPLATFTILTTEPAKDLRWLHDRMPCILENWDEITRWLDLGEVKGWEEGKGGTGSLLKGVEGLDSYAVPSEVGKIGNNSPTFIQPVAERSDGIKSFFQKQGNSPAKPKKEVIASHKQSKVQDSKDDVKLGSTPDGIKPEDVTGAAKPKIKSTVKQETLKEEAEGIKAEIVDGDVEKGLGDDSNAPNDNAKAEEVKEDNDSSGDPAIKEEGSPPGRDLRSKRKRNKRDTPDGPDDEGNTDGNPTGEGRKGGHQTKVTRRSADEGNKEQPAITSFFKSPGASKSEAAKSTPRRGR
ncbi:hypothetical protein IAU60_003708 [Kwoniella sp. DSM 27419]